MKKLIIIPLFFCALQVFSQTQLSDRAEISVITCGPFQGEVYSAFGHSAFLIHDPELGIDHIYNYGMFDFDQPNFYLNFARGKNLYMLGVQDWNRFREVYIYHNRFLHEQQLNLNKAQKQKLYEYLLWNALPENQNYYYDYFYDNCATRIRDVIVKNFADSVHFDDSFITTDYSIRQLTDLYLTYQPWGDLGIDICLGLPMDKKASAFEYMFLPDYIEYAFDNATINQNGSTVPLVKSKKIVYESRPEDLKRGFFQPWTVFVSLAVVALVISVLDFRRKKLSQWFDVTLFGITGLIGILLLFLWVATDHKAAAKNFNLLWALPTNLIAVIAFYRNPKWLEKYFFGVAVLSALLLITWAWLPQQLNQFLIPFVIVIMIRSFVQSRLRKNSLTY
jgi:hypothetical protein